MRSSFSWQKEANNEDCSTRRSGRFIEHEQKLKKLGASCVELRKAEDLKQSYDGLILPGGESTVQGKLLRELGMFDTLRAQILSGLPVLATCAGMILLADHIEGDPTVHFQTMPVTVRRNAYGRQLGSFHTVHDLKGLGEIPMTFIRAPYISQAADDVEVLAAVDGHIVAVRCKNQTALAFHPELDESDALHQQFLAQCKNA